MIQLPLASIAATVPETAIRPSANESSAAQTPPNTAPPTATRCGIGEGQHLHGAGMGQRAAHEPVAWRGGACSAARALPVSHSGSHAKCINDGGDPKATADPNETDANALCVSA